MEDPNFQQEFIAGEEAPLVQVIELYGQPLLRYCHNILCDYTEAQDAVQVTFIKAYHHRKKFKVGTSISAWLYRIAYTTCIDILRRKKLLFFLPNRHINQEENLIGEDLREALLCLSPSDRALIYSRVIDEKSYGELEVIYNIPAVTLRKRYQRAKKKLANKLKETDSYYSRLEEKE